MAINATLWGRRVEITVSGSVSSLAGYVGLITESNLPSEIWTRALNGGGDLRVCLNRDGTNQLPLEVVLFDTVAQDATLWVRFPSFVTGSGVWLFYDRAGETQPPVTDQFGRNAVWQDYELIIHQGSSVDSTGNHTPSLIGSPSTTPLLWGDAYNLTSASQFISVPDSNDLEFISSLYVQIWTDAGGGTATRGLFTKSTSNNNGYRLFKRLSNNARFRYPNLSPSNLDGPALSGVVRTGYYFDGTSRRITENTNTVASDTPSGTVTPNSDPLLIGRNGSVDPLAGTLGEVWASNTLSYDSNKELIEYNNQLSPATFWSTGTPEDTGGGGATYTITLDAGSYSLTGQDVALLSNKLISLESSNYTYTGQNVDLLAGRSISLEQGNYTYAGQNINLLASRSISLEQGNYTYTGQDVTLVYNPGGGPTYLLAIDAGAYNYSGQDTQLIANRALSIDSGAYAYTGSDLSLFANRSISIDSGAYVVTGNAITLSANRAITLESGNYAYTGSPVTLSYSGEVIALVSGYSVNYAQDDATATYIDDYIKARFI